MPAYALSSTALGNTRSPDEPVSSNALNAGAFPICTHAPSRMPPDDV